MSPLPLKDRWKAFGAIIFDPWALLLILSNIFLANKLVSQSDVIVVTTLTFFVALFSGILGGIVAKRWDDVTEEKVIVTRGKSAYRSLQLLFNRLIYLEKRVLIYLHRFNDEKNKKQITPEVLKTYFEEVIDECLSLEENVINSIEDWTDILPNAEIKAVINLIRDLKINYSDAVTKLELVNMELRETKDKSDDQINKLTNEKRKITDELIRIKKEVRDKSTQVGIPEISGSLITGSNYITQYLDNLQSDFAQSLSKPFEGTILLDMREADKFLLTPKDLAGRKPTTNLKTKE
jgi:hypothetical protein